MLGDAGSEPRRQQPALAGTGGCDEQARTRRALAKPLEVGDGNLLMWEQAEGRRGHGIDLTEKM
jgi:hypothetical protein